MDRRKGFLDIVERLGQGVVAVTLTQKRRNPVQHVDGEPNHPQAQNPPPVISPRIPDAPSANLYLTDDPPHTALAPLNIHDIALRAPSRSRDAHTSNAGTRGARVVDRRGRDDGAVGVAAPCARRPGSPRRCGRRSSALWPSSTRISGDGEWVRRSAIAWMMGSWGARLAVQGIYTRAAHGPTRPRSGRPFWFFQALAAAAVVASLPALLASLNRDPNLSVAELAACALWVVGFAGETTADRQRLRFTSNPANEGLRCRTGLWRHSPIRGPPIRGG